MFSMTFKEIAVGSLDRGHKLFQCTVFDVNGHLAL